MTDVIKGISSFFLRKQPKSEMKMFALKISKNAINIYQADDIAKQAHPNIPHNHKHLQYLNLLLTEL